MISPPRKRLTTVSADASEALRIFHNLDIDHVDFSGFAGFAPGRA